MPGKSNKKLSEFYIKSFVVSKMYPIALYFKAPTEIKYATMELSDSSKIKTLAAIIVRLDPYTFKAAILVYLSRHRKTI